MRKTTGLLIIVTITVRAQVIETWLSTVSSELLIFSQKTIAGTSASAGLACKPWIAVFKVKATAIVKISICVRPEGIFWTAECFASKPDMMIHHHKLDCHAERLIFYLQGHGHRECSYTQNKTIPKVLNCWTRSSANKMDIHLRQHCDLSITKQNGGWGWEVAGICRGRRQILLIFETVNFSTISSDIGRFVWRHNTFLDQAMVFVNGV